MIESWRQFPTPPGNSAENVLKNSVELVFSYTLNTHSKQGAAAPAGDGEKKKKKKKVKEGGPKHRPPVKS